MANLGSSSNSALVVLVPEADLLVASYRGKYDPSAAAGMPAHITLLHPFLPPGEIAEPQIDLLRRCFAAFAPFRYSLGEIRLFPTNLIYIAPDPDEPFRQMTLAIWNCFPDRPPYGGQHPDIVPHLSVAQVANRPRRNRVAEEFRLAARGGLPIAVTGNQVALMDDSSGHWQTRTRFSLGNS